MPLTVTSTKPVTSFFYLRGVLVGTDSYTIDPAAFYYGEAYRLDVVCFNVDGKKAGSNTWTLTRHEVDPLTVAISGTVTTVDNFAWAVALVTEGSTHVASITATGLSVPFSFPGLSAENYRVRAWMDAGAKDGVYRPAEGDGSLTFFGGGSGTIITVPHAAGLLYNIAMVY